MTDLIFDNKYLLSLPSRRLPVECAFSPDGLFEARFRVRDTLNLREGEQLRQQNILTFRHFVVIINPR